MATSKIAGYKKIFGLVMPDWVDEKMLNMAIGYMLVSVVMLFVLMLVVNPNFDNVKKMEAKYKTESERLETMKGSKRNLDRLIEDVSPAKQIAVFRAMPVEYSPDEAVFSLRKIANETGTSIVEYSLPAGIVFEEGKIEFSGGSSTDKSTAVDFRSFVVQLSVEGGIKNILSFINRVQKSLPIAFVSDLGIQEIVRAEVGKAQSNVDLKLSVEYYQPILKSFNLAGLQSFSERELALLTELEGYATEIPASGIEAATQPITGGGQRNLFGQ